jgi:hypothetical protein
MRERNFSAEQIVTVLRQIEVLMAQGKAAVERPGSRSRATIAGAKTTAVLSWIKPGGCEKRKKTRCEVFLTQRCRLLANACIAASHS